MCYPFSSEHMRNQNLLLRGLEPCSWCTALFMHVTVEHVKQMCVEDVANGVFDSQGQSEYCMYLCLWLCCIVYNKFVSKYS